MSTFWLQTKLILFITQCHLCQCYVLMLDLLPFYRRLAKSTLILIPLFGVHYIVFIGVQINVEPTAEVVKLYFEMFFNSFQVMYTSQGMQRRMVLVVNFFVFFYYVFICCCYI